MLELFITSDLDESGMVLDFTFFNYLNDFIQRFIDHKFILDINDPLFDSITGVNGLDWSKCLVYCTITEIDGKIELVPTDEEQSLFQNSIDIVKNLAMNINRASYSLILFRLQKIYVIGL